MREEIYKGEIFAAEMYYQLLGRRKFRSWHKCYVCGNRALADRHPQDRRL